jgi:hypothetical protein
MFEPGRAGLECAGETADASFYGTLKPVQTTFGSDHSGMPDPGSHWSAEVNGALTGHTFCGQG